MCFNEQLISAPKQKALWGKNTPSERWSHQLLVAPSRAHRVTTNPKAQLDLLGDLPVPDLHGLLPPFFNQKLIQKRRN